MRVIVMGCGRVGSTLAARLGNEGHDVHVVDRDPKSRDLLPRSYPGRFSVGNGYHRTILEAAGVEHADAFVAVTSGDNTNVVGARTAKERYRVPLVIARIYDPRRADIYRELGILTVASVRWTVDQIRRTLLYRYLAPVTTFGNNETLLLRSAVPDYLAGRPLTDLEAAGEIRAVEVSRLGRSFIPEAETAVEQGDLVTFAVASNALDRLRGFLGRELGT